MLPGSSSASSSSNGHPNPNRSKRTNELNRYEANRYLGDWLPRPLDVISRADVETRFNSITADHGWSAANRAMSLLRSIYRRPFVDHDGLRNPVDLWLAGGGKFHPKARRKISAPSEVLPCWRAGIEAEVNNPAIHDALWFGLYTGMRRDDDGRVAITLQLQTAYNETLENYTRKPAWIELLGDVALAQQWLTIGAARSCSH